jgi:hypothetical protein
MNKQNFQTAEQLGANIMAVAAKLKQYQTSAEECARSMQKFSEKYHEKRKQITK